MPKLILILCLAILACDVRAADRISDVARSRTWLRLLHFRTNWFLHTRSLASGAGFFLAPDGHVDARAELVADLAAFGDPTRQLGPKKRHPQCAFPERYRFLKKELGLAIKDVPCPDLDEYLAKINARSLTLVFSSAFPNNPGSMFGHTFLRVNSNAAAKPAPKNDLLDQAISYAALVPPDHGGFEFAARGLFGGYIGRFALMPYYAKVNEYNNSESRDLWEYDLALDREQTLTVVRHIWELETNTWLDYYFFDVNCSYILLAALEVARPDWDITGFPIYVIPGETVKMLSRTPGAIVGMKFRPSLRRRMYTRLRALSKNQREEFFRLIGDARKTQGAPSVDTRDTAVLESVASYLYYRKQEQSGKLASADSDLLHAVLVRRAGLGVDEADRELITAEEARLVRPDLGHNTYRVGVAGGRAGAGLGWFQELELKTAFHDLLNDDTGYIRFSRVDFPGVTLRNYSDTGRFVVEHLQGLSLTSLFPMDFLEKRLSWKASGDAYSPKDYGCTSCLLARGEVGAGAAAELFSPSSIVYALASLDFEAGRSLRMGYRWGPKLETAVILGLASGFKTQLGYTLASDLLQPDRPWARGAFEWNQSYALSPWWELRSALSLQPSYAEGKVAVNLYF